MIFKKIKEVITKFFYPDNLNQKKEQEIYDKAFQLRLVKNYISEILFKNIQQYKEYSKVDLIKELAPSISNPYLTQKDIEYAIVEVWTTYRNKIDLIKKNIEFKVQNKIIKKYYKNNSKVHNRGDLRVFEVEKKSTKLSKVMSFLGRYGYVGIAKKIDNNLKDGEYKDDAKREVFYKTLSYFLNKYGEDRLLKLAFQKRFNTFNKYNRNQHQFSSLSFTTQSRIKHTIVNKNKNRDSKIDSFISIGGYKKDDKQTKKGISKKYQLDIPTKTDQAYHLNFNDYSKVYTMQFEENQLKRVNLTIEVEKSRPVANNIILKKPNRNQNKRVKSNKDKILGVDINIKHNLFATSDENIEIDYDRNLFNGFVKFLKKLDKREKDENGKTKKLGKKKNKAYQRWQNRVSNMVIESTVELIKQAKERGYNHLVLEDLELMSKLRSNNQEFDINNGRLIKLLNLSSIKNRIINIAHKYQINISFIHPEYTSQTCNRCGSISRKNRKTQEEFRCIECGHIDNADFNSACNIRDRLLLDVLRVKFLNINNFSEYKTKGLRKETIKYILEDYYRVA